MLGHCWRIFEKNYEDDDKKIPLMIKVDTKNVIKVFKAHGLHAAKIGETGGEYIQLNKKIKVKVREARHRWENGLREKL